ncbi:MAG: hypothetical protein K0S97_1114 [Chloroflexota bacterium]|jgi:hypothetical protein|nr:hypothetical protein [Chloroflexota bacterium]
MSKGRLIVVIAAAAVLAIGVAPAIDRASRSQSLDGITTAGALHVAPDGRLVVTEVGTGGSADGRVVVVDPRTDRREILLDGLSVPRAADMDAAGTVCAVLEAIPPEPPELRCSDGRRVDLSPVEPDASWVARPIDVVWDGGNGWFVAEPSNTSLLHVGTDDIVALVDDFHVPTGAVQPVPVGLTRSLDGKLWLALSDGGIAAIPLDGDAPPVHGQWVGGASVVGVIPRREGEILLYSGGTTGWVAWCCGVHGGGNMIVDGFAYPRSLALLPDGRLAISADGRVTLYRANALPGGEP